MRHGQTDMNIKKIMQGRTDILLNDKGRAQAKLAHDFFQSEGISFSHVVTSPLSRAYETACIASQMDEEDIRIDIRLLEIDFGPYEGQVFDLEDDYIKSLYLHPETFTPAPGAESYQELIARSADLIEEARSRYANTTDSDNINDAVLFVAHGAVMRAILSYVLDLPLKDFWSSPVDNCTVYRLDLDLGNDHAIQVFPGFRRDA